MNKQTKKKATLKKKEISQNCVSAGIILIEKTRTAGGVKLGERDGGKETKY